MWWSMISLRENLTLHIGQEKGFSPVWLLRCRLRCSLRPKALSQLDIGQVNFFVLLKFLILSPPFREDGVADAPVRPVFVDVTADPGTCSPSSSSSSPRPPSPALW